MSNEEFNEQLRTGTYKAPGFVYEPGYDLELALASVGKGWAKLIEEVFANKPPEINITQVKEKFGGLRIYIDNYTDEEFLGVIAKVEKQSYETCETCGQPGKLREKHYWYSTRCDEHERK